MNIKNQGFSLLELMVVLGVIALLTMLAVPSLMKFIAKAKRSEALTQLRALHMAQKAYFIEHGTYTTSLSGADSIGWDIEGKHHYTYGFKNGSEGKNYITGSLNAPASALENTYADQKGFVAGAAADIDGDGQLDVLTIDQKGIITYVKDDLT